MADYSFRDAGNYDQLPPVGGGMSERFTKLANVAGALTSVALIAGLAVWGYRLAVRDVSGIPVIQAMEGPSRIQPENPGGELARHTGLAVTRIAADGEAAPTADRLALAPAPDELGEDARPMAELRPAPRIDRSDFRNAEAADAALVTPEAARPALLSEEITPEDAAAARAIALADEIAAGAEPLTPLEPEPALDILPASVPGVARSPRPAIRPAIARGPASSAVSAALAEALAPEPESSVDIDAASLPSGTRLVQLGAFDDAATARREWEKIAARFSTVMEGKSRVIQKTENGGRSFYRLRVHGFEDSADANRFCAVLLAGDALCISVQIR